VSPRKASLRVAHQRTCANKTKTALSSVGRGAGCTCAPSYYTFHRDRDGRVVKGPRVSDRREAERSLRSKQVDIDQGRLGTKSRGKTTFSDWADEYETIIEPRVKPRTLEGYKQTLARARNAFGSLYLSEIGNSELRKFDEVALKPASRLRYLRELSACFQQAVDDDKLETNPVPSFSRRLNLKKPKRGKAPFEIDELPRLWTALEKRKVRRDGKDVEIDAEPVYLHAAKLSAETGLRLRELVGLDWQNVSLSEHELLVEFQYQEKAGLIAPKDGEARRLYLTGEALAVLTEWGKIAGAPDDGPVFPNPEAGGRLSAQVAQDRLVDAMERAGIPKIHPKLKLPRTYHSLRYTTSNLMQHRGKHPRFIEQTLGHSSLELSFGVYGGWTPTEMAQEAARGAA
jgi:integrase